MCHLDSKLIHKSLVYLSQLFVPIYVFQDQSLQFCQQARDMFANLKQVDCLYDSNLHHLHTNYYNDIR